MSSSLKALYPVRKMHKPRILLIPICIGRSGLKYSWKGGYKAGKQAIFHRNPFRSRQLPACSKSAGAAGEQVGTHAWGPVP
jgi:hypothetical protein